MDHAIVNDTVEGFAGHYRYVSDINSSFEPPSRTQVLSNETFNALSTLDDIQGLNFRHKSPFV